ncbi:uncharacterized protein FIBRA_00815 [Fibroporia radiculosa]|uniref:Uncharacterized protein n=1 Tax=Fibroporia radiculosa TaxID=599839 RepID=J4GIN8_9APHY|nr:uncharacterized protein FIBRA_00815 [Fibroporia radiculosa]CCL98810.1 predicted protein [Fibroporia radiculosa]
MLDAFIDMLPMIVDIDSSGKDHRWHAHTYIRRLMCSINDWPVVRVRLRRLWKHMMTDTSGTLSVVLDCTVEVSSHFENELDRTDLEFLLSEFLSPPQTGLDTAELLKFAHWCLNLARVRKWLELHTIRDELRALVATVCTILKDAVLKPQILDSEILTMSEVFFFTPFIAECARHVEDDSGVLEINMLTFLADLVCSCELYKVWEYDMQKEVRKIRELVCLPGETIHDADVWLSSVADEQPARKERAFARLRASCNTTKTTEI